MVDDDVPAESDGPRADDNDELEEADEESVPASDPPATWSGAEERNSGGSTRATGSPRWHLDASWEPGDEGAGGKAGMVSFATNVRTSRSVVRNPISSTVLS